MIRLTVRDASSGRVLSVSTIAPIHVQLPSNCVQSASGCDDEDKDKKGTPPNASPDARTGAVAINGLDGTNYAGTVSLTPSTALFAGSLAGNVGNRAMSLNGSFFQGGASNTTPLYGEMGGSLILNGNGGYLGSGVFLGRKP